MSHNRRFKCNSVFILNFSVVDQNQKKIIAVVARYFVLQLQFKAADEHGVTAVTSCGSPLFRR